MLDIHLIGTPRVHLNGEQISVQRTRTRAVLFYLAMHPQGVDRGRLAEYFGGKGDETKKRGRLRRYLNFVRQIADELDFVDSYHDTVRLNTAMVTVDVLEILLLANEVKTTQRNTQNTAEIFPGRLLDEVQIAVENLDAVSFIDSNDFDKVNDLEYWKEQEDIRLKKALGVLFNFLAEMYGHVGKTEASLAWAERALQVDPSETSLFYQLKALRAMGKFDQARSVYELLIADYGDDLSQQTRDLGVELLKIKEPSPLYARPTWATRPSVHAPFAGRQAIIEQMHRNYQRGIGTLLTGETGVGKTRLVQQFYESLSLTPNLLLVPCYRDSENLSYQPWTDMLRHTFTEAFWKTTPALWTKPLTMLLPELLEYRDDLDAEPGDVFANELVFEAVRNLLVFANKNSAALVFVEDAQWMNPVSFSLLKYLILQATFKKWNIGLVVTSRLGMNAGLDRFEFDAMQGHMDNLEIGPLNSDEIKYLASCLLLDELSEENLAYLKRSTGGNTFLVLEMLKFHAQNEDQDMLSNLSKSTLSVQELISARLKPLSAQARKALKYAALQGHRFTLSTLEETLTIPIEEMTTVITELEEARLIEFVDQDNGLRYAFQQDKIREEILNTLSPAENRMLHAKIAEVLSTKNIYRNEHAAVLAEHYEIAEQYPQAFKIWKHAGKHAYRMFAIQDSHLACLRAEKLIPRISLTDKDIYYFYLSWQVVLFNSSEDEKLESVMKRLLAMGQDRGSSLLVGTALDGLSDVALIRSEFNKGLAYTEEAVAHLVMAEDIAAQINVFIHHGIFLYMLKDFTAALQSFQTAISLTKKIEKLNPATTYSLGHAHYQVAVVQTNMGHPRLALEEAERSLHYMRISAVPHFSILPDGIMALANYYLGDYSIGKEHAHNSLELAKEVGHWRMVGYTSAYAGMNEVELAEFGLAWQHAEEAIAYGKKYRHTEIIAMGHKIRGDIYSRLESPIKSVSAYQQGLAVDKESFVSVENAARLGVMLGLLGDPEADATLEAALATANEAGLETTALNARALQLSLFIARQDYDSYHENLGEIQDRLIERSHPKSFVWTDYLQALRYFQQGKFDESLALLEKTLPVLDEIEFFWIHLRTQRLYLAVRKQLGKDTAAIANKLEEMLKKIEQGLGDAPLQEEWQLFSARVRDEIK